MVISGCDAARLNCAHALIAAARQFQFLQIFALQRLLPSEQMSDESDLGKMLDGLHLHVSVMKRIGVSNHAMVGHEDGIVLGDQGFKRIGKFGRPWRTVLSQGNRA